MDLTHFHVFMRGIGGKSLPTSQKHSFRHCSGWTGVKLFTQAKTLMSSSFCVCRREPGSRRVQCEVCLQPEGSGAHAASEGGGGKWLVPCQQQVRPQPHTVARLWNHPACASPHWPGGVLWPAGQQLRALCYPSTIRGGGVRAGLSLFILCLSHVSH